jgi:hypothetical protein
MRSGALALGLAFGLVALGACEREEKALREDLPASRATRARADAQEIARAVRLYQATFGTLPSALDELTQARTIAGVTGGPFLARVPLPPAGWTPYEYAKHGGHRFTVTSSAGGVSVTAP